MHSISRRAVTAALAAMPVAAIPTAGLASAGEDAELRRLYAEYQSLDRIATEAWEANRQARDRIERSVLGGKTINELSEERRDAWGPTLTEEEHTAWVRALVERPRPGLYEEACALSDRVRSVIRQIRSVPAEGLFGVAVKLVVLAEGFQGEDVEENVRYALEDINRLIDTDFTLAEVSLAEHLEEWGGMDAEDDEPEEEDADTEAAA